MISGFACTISAIWEPRAETPESLAHRLLSFFVSLRVIDPVFAEWYVWTSETTEVPAASQLDVLAHQITQTAELNVRGEPVQELGYRYRATNGKTGSLPQREFFMEMRAGGWWRSPLYQNSVRLRTLYKIVPDPRIVTYSIVRQVIVALADCFDALWCSAYSSDLVDLWQKKQGPAFEIAWISYLASRAAQSVRPPSSAVVERRGDGSLLMAATTETFDSANPTHLAVARDIEAAIASLRAMPWPPLAAHDA